METRRSFLKGLIGTVLVPTVWAEPLVAESPAQLPEGAVHRLTGHTSGVCTVAWSPDGKTLVSGGWDKTIRFWNSTNGKEVRQLPGNQDSDLTVAWSPDGKMVASASVNSYETIRLWETATGKEIRSLAGHNKALWQVAWSPDGRTIASTSFDGTVRLWDVATGKQARILDRYGAPVTSLAWSPDGKTLAWGGGVTIRFWDLRKDKQGTMRPRDPEGTVESICWSPDGKLLASAGSDKLVQIWDVAAGKLIRKLVGHKEGVRSVAWSPDSRWLALASHDGTILMLEIATGREVRRFAGHAKAVLAVCWSPDGKSLASASADNTLVIWAPHRSSEESASPGASRLNRLWADLADADAAKGHRAICFLTQSAGESVSFLSGRLKPMPVHDAVYISRLIADLDSNRFAIRQQATAELDRLEASAEPELRKALARKPPLEVRHRIDLLLKQIKEPSSESLRGMRSIAVLEYIGSTEAKQLLEKLATGSDGVRLTKQAKASLRRLNKAMVAAR